MFPRAWHGRRPATHRPSPGPPHGVGEAGLVGVAGRLPGNSCVMAAHRGHAAHPGPAEVAQARNNDHLGLVGGSRARLPAAWWDISCARHPGNTPLHAGHRRDRLSRSEPGCARRARSAARAYELFRASGGSVPQWLRFVATGAGKQVGMVSRPAVVRPLWSRGHVRTRSGRWLRG